MAGRKFYFQNGDLVFRNATHTDYQGAIDIDDNVYDGLDYMPAMFDHFLQSRQQLVIVFDDGGKIYGLMNFRFSDNDPHVVAGMSGRIVAERRGQGEGSTKAFDEMFIAQFPQLTHALFVTRAKFVKPGGYEKIFYTWRVLAYRFDIPTLRIRLFDFRSPIATHLLPRQLTYQTIGDLLTSGDQLERFLSRYCIDYVVAQWHWRPMKIDKHDLKELFATASLVLYTDHDEQPMMSKAEVSPDGVLPPATRSAQDIVGPFKSLSYSYFLPVKFGLVTDVFFFGEDPSVAAIHAVIHARHLATIWNGNVGFSLHVPLDMDYGRVDAAVNDVLGPPFEVEGMHYLRSMPFKMGIRRLPELNAKL